MVHYKKYTLSNGLRLIVHQDKTSPVAALNILYDVGARDEHPEKTGFAHLFEHLMFGGSINIPDFDQPLQAAGGTSNAFTSNDITNYYETIPLANLDTLFWLESDRLLSLAFTDKSLEVQRSVVIEEFKQRYLNQPYGDVWHLLRSNAFKVHPYQWPTIGKEISHIEQATMEDVKTFFFKHYTPANAILCVAGNVDPAAIAEKAEEWFGKIEVRKPYQRELPVEPIQGKRTLVEVDRKVPQSMLIKAFHMCARRDPEYYTVDLISDLLSRGKSSRLYRALVLDRQIFTEVHCYVSGDLDPGLIVVNGMLADGVTMAEANLAVDEVLNQMTGAEVDERELQKVRNKYLSSKGFDNVGILSKAMNLCYYELLGDIELVNTEENEYRKVTPEMIRKTSAKLFRPENETVIYYNAVNQ